MARDDERLLREDDYYRDERERREFSKLRACLCCCVCIIIIVGVAAAIYSLFKTHKHHKKHSDGGKIRDENSVSFHDKNKPNINLPKNLTQLLANNEKLCHTVTSKDSTGVMNNLNHIFIIKGDKNLTDEQACGIESILRLFPDKTIFIIDFDKKKEQTYVRCSGCPNYIGLLLYLYKERVELVYADRVQFFKNTPLQELTQRKDIFEFLAMLLTAYKYGGLVVSPEVVMTTRDLVECFPEETVVEPFVILASKKCDDFLHYLMESLRLCGSNHSATLDEVLSQSIELFGRSQSCGRHSARRLTPHEVCDNVQDPCTFLPVRAFANEETKWVCELSTFCKQVVQAFLGIKINQMEVEEETSRIKSHIKESKDNKICKFSIKDEYCNETFKF